MTETHVLAGLNVNRRSPPVSFSELLFRDLYLRVYSPESGRRAGGSLCATWSTTGKNRRPGAQEVA